jgi:hypothetical protein
VLESRSSREKRIAGSFVGSCNKVPVEIQEFVYWLAETGYQFLRNARATLLCKEIHSIRRRHKLCVAKIVGLQQNRIYKTKSLSIGGNVAPAL